MGTFQRITRFLARVVLLGAAVFGVYEMAEWAIELTKTQDRWSETLRIGTIAALVSCLPLAWVSSQRIASLSAVRVISTEVTLRYLDVKGDAVELTRKHELRPLRAETTDLVFESDTLDADGTIEVREDHLHKRVEQLPATALEVVGNNTKKVLAIKALDKKISAFEEFINGIVPLWLGDLLFDDSVRVRTVKIIARNHYNRATQNKFNLTILNNTVKKFTVRLMYPPNDRDALSDFRALKLSSHSVARLTTAGDGECACRVDLPGALVPRNLSTTLRIGVRSFSEQALL